MGTVLGMGTSMRAMATLRPSPRPLQVEFLRLTGAAPAVALGRPPAHSATRWSGVPPRS
jgi:hypothetical protein